jgi:hypothetical protein
VLGTRYICAFAFSALHTDIHLDESDGCSANPESLKIYALHGTSLHINWVDKAEKAVVDAVRASTVPKVCNSEGNIALLHAFGGNIPARARHVLDNADRDAGDETAPPAYTAGLITAHNRQCNRTPRARARGVLAHLPMHGAWGAGMRSGLGISHEATPACCEPPMRRYLHCPGAICCPARRALRAVLQPHPVLRRADP